MMKHFTFFSKNLFRHLLPVTLLLISCTLLYGQAKHVITVRDFQFNPDELEIAPGDTVEWRNEQGYHNVNGTQETFSSNPESFGNEPGNGWTYQYLFTVLGTYNFQCDPHFTDGMNGSITVLEGGGAEEENVLSVQFSGMNPHVGQDIYLAVVDAATGIEVGRTHTVGETEFTLMIPGIETGKPYSIDFWADHNQNGMYDGPPTDHAWRLELDEAMGDTTLLFAHNTNFTDIIWKNMLTVEFSSMNPHVGQDIYLAVVDGSSGMEVRRTHTVGETDFSLMVPGIESGKSYHIDFWADHNQNGMYDSPPTDHAWRLELDEVSGDTTLLFVHNTSFTDIMWKGLLTVEFSSMNPHVGQNIQLAVTNRSSGNEIGRVQTTGQTDFALSVPGIETGGSYYVNFWADHNQNGMYDAPPADHAWRLELDEVSGDTTLIFIHNTSFTDIMWKSMLTVEFSGMNPHVGQDIYLAIYETESGTEVGRTHTVGKTDFSLMVAGIEAGKSYHVDFWADHNQNGMYDAPPADHAWRLELNDVMGDTTLMFVHNTDFTDIMWRSQLTVEFTGMIPHVGQVLKLYVVDAADNMVQDSIVINEVQGPDFTIHSSSLTAGSNYLVNFYADHNQNGMYDAPPADHAWQLTLDNVAGDTTLTFAHNTNFTDIFPATSVDISDRQSFKMYPNPAKDFIYIEDENLISGKHSLSIIDISGRMAAVEQKHQSNRIVLDIRKLNRGMYLLKISSGDTQRIMKLLKE